MMLTPIQPNIEEYPAELHQFLYNAKLYDSSGHSGAYVIFIDKGSGYFLKSAPKGELEREAAMAKYFHAKKLSANVLAYISSERDFMLSEKISGDDCAADKYLEQPERLCDIIAELLVMLHSLDFTGCPVNHTQQYLASAEQNFHTDAYDKSHFPDSWGYATAEEAYQVIKNHGHLLQSNTLLHGDYCLPNIMLDEWKFSSFIDLAYGGIGDRHVDLFWGMWSLKWNLKTDNYKNRFLDAYGREKIDIERFKIIRAVEVFG